MEKQMIVEEDITKEEFSHKAKKSMEVLDSELNDAAKFAILEANHWYDAVQVLMKHPKHFDSQICVLSLLSLELYMKSILMSKGINVTKEHMGHKIYEMYISFSEEEKEKIQKDVHIDRKEYLSLFGEHIIFNNFDEELKYISNDFVYLRYEYEKFMNGIAILTLPKFILKVTENTKRLARNLAYGEK